MIIFAHLQLAICIAMGIENAGNMTTALKPDSIGQGS